jgi:hypothetical protein
LIPGSDRIPWKRFAVEAVAIVVSILLAFAIDAWWDDRKERVLEQEMLHDLRAEYEDHKDDVSLANVRHLNYLRAIETLLDACQQGSWRSDEFSLDDAFFALQVPETQDLGEGVRDTLISSGKLETLSDRELRYELAEWDSVLDELLDDQLNNTELVMSLVLPYLARSGVSMSGPLSKAPGQQFWSIPKRSQSISSETIASICSDPEFLSIVEIRYGYMVHTAFEFDRLISAIERMLVQIGAPVTE